MFLPFVITKPDYVANLVDRPRLFRQLDRWRDVRVIVIHAPPGYGKSSLLSRWLDVHGHAGRVAWLSLDESDADPRQLVRGLAAALDAILPGLAAAMQPVLDAPQSEPPRALARLLEALWEGLDPRSSALREHWLLILDDVHLIAASEAVTLLKPLLEKGPPNLHVVLLARTMATLPLSRLYATGQVLELTADDLRFTGEEVRAFLTAHQESCSPAELQQIVERTGGWVVALQLAMHSQRGHGSLAEHLRTLRGDSRWLAQYLTQEVLAQQSPAMRSFLLRTSILDSFSAPLCQAVAGGDDAYQTLAELHDKQLFVIQLDAEGVWFRYHHLFQELLQQRLLEVEGKAAVDRLHRQAAGWLASQDRLLLAIRHLQRAGDEDGAAALVESRIRPFILHHPTQAYLLFDALSPDAILRRPRLALERCLASLMMLNTDLAGHVRNAQRSLAEHVAAGPQRLTWEAELLVYRVAAHYMSGEIEEATALAQEAQSSSRHLDRLLQGVLEFLWLHLSLAANDEAAARRHGRRALAAFEEADMVVGLVAVRRELAQLEIRAGRSTAASRELEAIIADFGGNRAVLSAELAWAHILAAEHCYWQDQLEPALRHLQAARELAAIYEHDATIQGLTYLSRLYQVRSGHPAAEGLPDTGGEAVPAPYPIVDWQIRWLLACGRSADAWRMARGYRARLAGDPSSLAYRLAIPYLRAVVAHGVNLAEAQPLLDHTLARAVAGRDYPRQLELLALRAWLELQTGQESAAAATLAQAEELAAMTGYVRMLLDIPALAALRAAPANDAPAAPPERAATDSLLTDQERAVLAGLAADRTYDQIAAELYISVNTVRTHVKHLYRKLDAHRRDQAIQRARGLGLVD